MPNRHHFAIAALLISSAAAAPMLGQTKSMVSKIFSDVGLVPETCSDDDIKSKNNEVLCAKYDASPKAFMAAADYVIGKTTKLKANGEWKKSVSDFFGENSEEAYTRSYTLDGKKYTISVGRLSEEGVEFFRSMYSFVNKDMPSNIDQSTRIRMYMEIK